VFQTTASILISLWSESNGNDGKYLYVFVGLTLSANVFIFFQALILTFTGVKQGKSVHRNIIKGLLYANLIKFFNRVPVGRIVNRLSKDLKEMDEVISSTFCSFLTTAFKILSSIVICIYTSTPFTLIPVLIVGVVFVKLRNVYIASQNELIRL
jgi:ATP-binding cassette, subfamily C (CFTR/MRP), member 1